MKKKGVFILKTAYMFWILKTVMQVIKETRKYINHKEENNDVMI